MSTNYPGGLDDNTTLPNPGAGSYSNNPSHLGQHDNENDAIKALEAKVGIGASTPPGGGFIFTSSSTGASSWQAAPAAGVWGLITGTLSAQTDLQAALNAKVAGPGSSVANNVPTFSGTSGKIIQDSGKAAPAGAFVGDTDTQTLTNKTLTGGLATADPTLNLGIATKQYVDNQGTTTIVMNEVPGGLVNSSNTAYTTASTYATGSLQVYLNGQRLNSGVGIDYVEISSGFTMQYAPTTGDVLLVGYLVTNSHFIQGSNSIIVQETPTGLVNSSNTLYTVLQAKYVANTLEVYLNGLQQTKTTDYTETSPGSGTFTFTTAPVTGDTVRVCYQFSTGASGNADTVDGIHANATPTANQLVALDSSAHIPFAALLLLGNTVTQSSLLSTTTTGADVPGCTITINPTVPSTVYIWFSAKVDTAAAANEIQAQLTDSVDGVKIAYTGSPFDIDCIGSRLLTTGSLNYSYNIAAGSRTIKVQGISSSVTTGNINFGRLTYLLVSQ